MEKKNGFDLEDLIEQVDVFQKQREWETLASISRENLELRKRIDRIHRTYDQMITLMDITKQAIQFLQRSIESLESIRLDAEKEWLAFRGITVENAKYSRIGFI